jgi:hypothetical protein
MNSMISVSLAFTCAMLAANPPALQFAVSLPPGTAITAVVAAPDGDVYAAGNSNGDATVLRLDESGQVIWKRDLGGTADDSASAIALDSEGSIYIGGWTASSDFPTVRPLINRPNFDSQTRSCGFLAKISSDGNLLYSTYYYQSGGLNVGTIQIQSSNEILLGGTASRQWTTFGSSSTGFVAKLNPQGDRLIFHTEFSGSGISCSGGSACIGAYPNTTVRSVETRASDGWILIAGSTNTREMATPDALQTACYCNSRTSTGWLGLLDPNGRRRYLTYLSGQQFFNGNFGLGNERLMMASLDAEGNIQAAGITRSMGFPTTIESYQPLVEGCTAPCMPPSDISYYSVVDGVSGRMRASTLYGGKEASLRAAVPDPSGAVWMMGVRRPFLVLMKPDASGLAGSWPAPSDFLIESGPFRGPAGFTTLNFRNQIRHYRWQDEGPRIYAVLGTIEPGNKVDVYTAGYQGQARLYFDGILAAAEEVPGEPGHWKATIPDGNTRNAIIDLALIADEQLSVTRISTN